MITQGINMPPEIIRNLEFAIRNFHETDSLFTDSVHCSSSI